MKLPSLSSLRWPRPAHGVSSIGQFRRWAFAAVLLAAAAVRVWTADQSPSAERSADHATGLHHPSAVTSDQPAASDDFLPGPSPDLRSPQSVRISEPLTARTGQQPARQSSGVQQANYWQASSTQQVRPAVPVPASYPDATWSPQPATSGTTRSGGSQTTESATPLIATAPTGHSQWQASSAQTGLRSPTVTTAPAAAAPPSTGASDGIVIRPGHAPLSPSAELDSGPPIHVFPNRMGARPLDAHVPGQPPVHVFPELHDQPASGQNSPALTADGRPTSVLPPHLQPNLQPSLQPHDRRSTDGPRPFGLTSQPRPLDPTDTTLILPPSQPAALSPSPLPAGRSFSSSGGPDTTEVFAPPATGGPVSGIMPVPTGPSALSPLPPGSNLPSVQTYDLPVNPRPAEVIVPGESSDLLSWWERDITRPVFRKRRPMNLTLEQALGLSISEAPELQVLHSDWFIRQVEIARQDAAFDWTSFVDGIWNRDSVPVSSSLDGATNRLRSRTSSGQAGLRKLLRDGGELEFSQVVGTENSNSQFISPNNQGTSRLQVEWTHRLLRGGGEAYNSSRVRIAAIENDSSFDLFQEGVQDHLLNVSSAYWILVLRRGRFVQSVTSWNRAKSVADEMARRVDVDVTPAMMDRARSEVADRLAGCIEAQHDVYRAQDALLRLIYGPQFVQYANNEVITQTLPMKQAPPVAAEPQIEQAIRNRSEVHRSIRNIKIAAVQYEVAEDEVLPVLDMTLTGYAAGLRGNNDIGGSIANQFTQGEPGVGIGFNFEMPYRNRAALAAAEQARVAIKRMQAELETTIANVSEDVRDQVTQRNKYGAVLRQQWESLARSRRLLKTTQTRRRYLADGARVGDLYLENLLQMQERLEQAESTYLQSQIRFAVADNALLRAVSMLDTLAVPASAGHGPGAAVREAVGRKSSSHLDVSRDPHLSGYDPQNLDAVYEPPQPPIAR